MKQMTNSAEANGNIDAPAWHDCVESTTNQQACDGWGEGQTWTVSSLGVEG